MIVPTYILITLMLPLGLGYAITLYLTRHHPLPKVFCLAVGYGLGTGLLTQWMLFLGVFNIPLSAAAINIPLFALLLACLFALKKNGIGMISLNFKKINPQKKPDFLCLLMFLYISIYTVYIFWRAFNIPIFSWDVFSVYAFQAKVIFLERSLQQHPNFPHYTYPLHTPFLQA